MSDIRELLELAARAMGYKRSDATIFAGWNAYTDTRGVVKQWEPDTHSGDCADMCAALWIGTLFPKGATAERLYSVSCSLHNADTFGRFLEGPFTKTEQFSDHNNDRSAAWRMAALRVAAEIGRVKG